VALYAVFSSDEYCMGKTGMACSRLRQLGFNLAELTATLAIVGISASLALPNMQSITLDSDRTATINELALSLRLARSEAVTRNIEVTMCPTLDGERCTQAQWSEGWLVFVDPDHDRQVTVGDTVLRQTEAVDDLDILSEEFQRFLVYRPDGHLMVETPNENTGLFTICDARGAEAARVLAIYITGQPRLADQQPDGSPPDCNAA
jgi:type IV fimbrial biogenesis protein FimT